MADRITINAGGRRFETSTTTLMGSGAGYFEALLGETGQKLRGRKRARAPEVTRLLPVTPKVTRLLPVTNEVADVSVDMVGYRRESA